MTTATLTVPSQHPRIGAILRGKETLSEEAALDALRVLLPVVRADPSWKVAGEELERLVARIEPGAVAAVADWWLVAGARRTSQDRGAYLLPDEELGLPLARWMTLVRELDTRLPPLRWIARRGALGELVARARQLLELDAHGNVKLPSLRTVWREAVLPALEPAVRAMEGGRAVPGGVGVALDDGTVRQALDRAGIVENSPLWGNFLKRTADARAAVGEAAACFADVEPWRPRADPGPWREALPGRDAPLGRALALALEIEPDDAAGVAGILEREAAAASDPERCRLEALTRGFRIARGVRVPSLDAFARRQEELRAQAEKLREAGAPDEDVQLAIVYLDDGELAEGTKLLESMRAALEATQRVRRLAADVAEVAAEAAAYPALAARAEALAQGLAGTAEAATAEAAAAADGGGGAKAPGDPAAAARVERAERELRALRAEVAAAVRAERTEQVEKLVAALEKVAPVGPLLAEGRRMLEALRAAGGGAGGGGGGGGALPAASEVDALQDRVRQAETEARRRIERVIAWAEGMLAERREQLQESDAREVAETLRLARERYDEGALRKAEELAIAGRDLVERRQVPTWTAARGEALLVKHLVAYLQQAASFAERDILRLHVALKTKRFAILAGLTGSGKSTIARLYAEALGATAENGRLWRVAVRPNWVDETEVLGYLNPLNGAFVPGWLATLIRACQRDPDLPFFCILDEMNLAPVEQYLADALSAMEEARSGSAVVRVSLYPPGSRPANAEEWEPALPWPANLFLVGTVNVDESTRAISDRVLDRANVLQLSVAFGDGHHLARRPEAPERRWLVRFSEWLAICRDEPADTYHELLTEIGRTFVRMRIGLGMRSHVELERFLANAEGVMNPQEALDAGVLQRIIPKVRGFKRDLAAGLRALRGLLAEAGLTRSVAVLDDWLSEEVSEETFLDGTDARVGLVSG